MRDYERFLKFLLRWSCWLGTATAESVDDTVPIGSPTGLLYMFFCILAIMTLLAAILAAITGPLSPFWWAALIGGYLMYLLEGFAFNWMLREKFGTGLFG